MCSSIRSLPWHKFSEYVSELGCGGRGRRWDRFGAGLERFYAWLRDWNFIRKIVKQDGLMAMARLGGVERSQGTETGFSFWQLSSLESLKMKTGFVRGIHSAFTGQLLPARNTVGAGKTIVQG